MVPHPLMGAIGDLFRALARWPFLALVAIFFVAGFVLTMVGLVFGFDLGDVDRWLEARGGWLGALGDLLFRAVCGLVFLFCVAIVGTVFYAWRSEPENRLGMGCGVLAAALIGYFAWIGMTAAP